MAYQTVKKPRFYVCLLQWLKSKGMIVHSGSAFSIKGGKGIDLIGINPTHIKQLSGGSSDGLNDTIVFRATGINSLASVMYENQSFQAILGHNFYSANAKARISEGEATGDDGGWNYVAETSLVNGCATEAPAFNGYSIMIGDDTEEFMTNKLQFRFDCESSEGETAVNYNINPIVGSLLFGNYYDLVSPELSLKQSFSYEGTKLVSTRGGSTLSNTLYDGSPLWGGNGAWELSQQVAPDFRKLRRGGRRSWDLSFSYMSGQDLFGSNMSLNRSSLISEISGVDSDDLADNGGFNYNLLTDNNFFSQVLHKTNGGTLPFIFQPDNLYPEFAIVRMDKDSFTFDQVAAGVYNISLQLIETW